MVVTREAVELIELVNADPIKVAAGKGQLWWDKLQQYGGSWAWPVTMVTTHENSIIAWSFKLVLCPVEPTGNEKVTIFHIMMLFYELHLIQILSWISY